MNNISSDKLPPQNIEAEKSLLGSIIIDREAINKVADFMRPEDFYNRAHQNIYRAVFSLFEKREPIDLLSISNKLSEVKLLDDVGGISYISSLASSVPTSAHVNSYAKIVQKKKMLRDLIDTAHHILGLGYQEDDDVDNLLDEAEKKLFAVSSRSLTKTFLPLDKLVLDEAMSRITSQHDEIRGCRTNFPELDDTLGGLQKSDLIILAARPSVGKTAFALNMALNVAKQNVPVGIFSMEMSLDQIVDRFLALESGVSLHHLRTGKLGEELQDVAGACETLRSLPIYVDDTPSPNILQMRAMARRLQSEHGLELLIVDYLQLMSSRRNYDSPVQQVTEISRGLKGLAKELNIPIVAVSQLSRAVEQREGHKPRLSDLRDSGCLTGDSLIMRADTGEMMPIKKLAERKEQTPIPIYSLGDNLKLSVQTLTRAFSSGRKKIYELKLRSGRIIKASSNHPFYKLSGWHALEDIKVNDKIAIPREIKIFNKKSSLSNDELVLLAHLLGDGCILPRQPFHYTSADPKNINIVAESAEKLFTIKSRIVKQKNWWHAYLPSPYHLTHNKKHPISMWFDKLGISRVHSYDKIIPNKIFEQPNDKIALFVRHLWATDGNISWKKLKNRKPSAAIYYSSTSRTLISQLQHLLIRFGIQSTTRETQKESYRINYGLHIQGTGNQLRFLEEIGCFGSRGKIIPSLVGALREINSNVNLDVIPKEAWKLMIQAAKIQAGFLTRTLSAELHLAYNGLALQRNGISRDRMHRFALVLKNKILEELADSDLYWDEVVSINKLGVEEVYDATVAGTHNFIANDIIVHNSIEQDADLVMFIHRDDKNNFEKAKRENKLNQAQVVIAKHRNGPTGQIDFYVDPASLRFKTSDRFHTDEYLMGEVI